jgi:hypothetical protein
MTAVLARVVVLVRRVFLVVVSAAVYLPSPAYSLRGLNSKHPGKLISPVTAGEKRILAVTASFPPPSAMRTDSGHAFLDE